MFNEEEKDLPTFTGKVVWFNKVGYGFIEWFLNGVKQPDSFVHFSGIDNSGFRMLYADQKVSFQIGLNHRGQPKAINVKVLEDPQAKNRIAISSNSK